jgi:hypothetical protein
MPPHRHSSLLELLRTWSHGSLLVEYSCAPVVQRWSLPPTSFVFPPPPTSCVFVSTPLGGGSAVRSNPAFGVSFDLVGSDILVVGSPHKDLTVGNSTGATELPKYTLSRQAHSRILPSLSCGSIGPRGLRPSRARSHHSQRHCWDLCCRLTGTVSPPCMMRLRWWSTLRCSIEPPPSSPLPRIASLICRKVSRSQRCLYVAVS